ncbi:hypothetical protein CEXT_665261 [Caerostris extrusa]|uniref:Uncharacterized protein n=1 Tax=Caerostris extrusa TaxID=172846 RepID=A0AAV4NEF1_CAEEX|nr:hypothetical protein CEXT_665261 [Caerostris extrusa]
MPYRHPHAADTYNHRCCQDPRGGVEYRGRWDLGGFAYLSGMEGVPCKSWWIFAFHPSLLPSSQVVVICFQGNSTRDTARFEHDIMD